MSGVHVLMTSPWSAERQTPVDTTPAARLPHRSPGSQPPPECVPRSAAQHLCRGLRVQVSEAPFPCVFNELLEASSFMEGDE